MGLNRAEVGIAVARAMSPDDVIDGALSSLCLAGAFVSQPETWPVFLAWVKSEAPVVAELAAAVGQPWDDFSPRVMAEAIKVADYLLGDPDD